MKIATIIGARPQFIKAASISRVLRANHKEIMIHTGQHYDENMSAVFFDELGIPSPDYMLGVGSGSHAFQTAKMLVGIEEVLIKEKPDKVLVYGDTNSTLAGALAASKLLIPVAHVEAGLRSYNNAMPEEQNRVLTDHISSQLFCPTKTAVDNLKKEGIIQNVYLVGDVMCDAIRYYSSQLDGRIDYSIHDRLNGLYDIVDIPDEWYLATIHRAENTDQYEKIKQILCGFEQLDRRVIFPVHPRTRNFIDRAVNEEQYANVLFVEPVGYLDMIYLTKNAKKVITDSGGLQKEAYMMGVDVVTVRDQTEWVETLEGNHNTLCKPESKEIVRCVKEVTSIGERKQFYGNGHAAEEIVSYLVGENG